MRTVKRAATRGAAVRPLRGLRAVAEVAIFRCLNMVCRSGVPRLCDTRIVSRDGSVPRRCPDCLSPSPFLALVAGTAHHVKPDGIPAHVLAALGETA